MAFANIIEELDAEITRLEQARKLLSNGARLGEASLTAVSPATGAKKAGRRKKRTLSPEARRRMAEAQGKRWAAAKKQAE